MPGGSAIVVVTAMLAQSAPSPAASAPAPTSVEPAAPPPASAPEAVYAPLWSSAPPPRPAPALAPPRRSGDGMLICGGLLAGGFAAAMPIAVGVFRSEMVCECGDGGFCGCGLGSLAVSPIVLFAAAPTLPLLWVGAWRRGRSDMWRRSVAPKGLRALGWSMLGLGVAFVVAGGVTLSQSPPDSPVGTITGSALIGGAYAATAAGGGVLLYTKGRKRGAAEMRLTSGGGLTLWF